jgi:hypothetical protein
MFNSLILFGKHEIISESRKSLFLCSCQVGFKNFGIMQERDQWTNKNKIIVRESSPLMYVKFPTLKSGITLSYQRRIFLKNQKLILSNIWILYRDTVPLISLAKSGLYNTVTSFSVLSYHVFHFVCQKKAWEMSQGAQQPNQTTSQDNRLDIFQIL